MSKTTSSLWKSSLDGLASLHVSHLTLSGAPKILLYCMEYNWPTTFLCPRDVSFLSNLPNLAYFRSMGCCILRDNDYSQDVPPNLSWLPAVPSNPSVLSNPTIFQETPWQKNHPYVNARAPPKPVDRDPHRQPNSNGVNSKTITSYHPPVPYVMGDHSGFVSFSPLATSFDVFVYGGSRDHSLHGGYRHGRHHPSRMGGHFTGGLSVASSIAGSLKPTSSDLSDTTLPEPVPVPALAPIPKAQPSAAAPHAKPEHTLTIKDKPLDLGIKPIKDKESWVNARKVVNTQHHWDPYWSGPSKELLTTPENAAAS